MSKKDASKKDGPLKILGYLHDLRPVVMGYRQDQAQFLSLYADVARASGSIKSAVELARAVAFMTALSRSAPISGRRNYVSEASPVPPEDAASSPAPSKGSSHDPAAATLAANPALSSLLPENLKIWRENYSRLFSDDPASATPWHSPGLARRMAVFSDVARKIAAAAFPEGEAPPDAVIQVSCTGYESPSAVQHMVADNAWHDATRVLSIGHMGCYAALPALWAAVSQAAGLAAQAEAASAASPEPSKLRAVRVSTLHIELCSLHTRIGATAMNELVGTHLFADGAIRYDVSTERPEGEDGKDPALGFIASFEAIVPGTLEHMTWKIHGDAFRMTLAPEIPSAIAAAIPRLVGQFLAARGLKGSDVAVYVVHPGGPRIVEGVAACLGLPPEKVRHSLAVLRDRGNMSSATVPHIWHAVLGDPAVAPGELILSLAFGPGLTVTGNLMRKL